MIAAKWELLILLPAVCAGSLLLRAIFLSEISPSPGPISPINTGSFVEAEELAIRPDSKWQHIGKTRQDTTAILPGAFSGNDFTWYSSKNPGDVVNLDIRLEKPGEYNVKAKFAKSADFGIVSFYINDELVLENLNLYSSGIESTDLIDLGKHKLLRKNLFKIAVTGSDERSLPPHYQCALDGLELEPVNLKNR